MVAFTHENRYFAVKLEDGDYISTWTMLYGMFAILQAMVNSMDFEVGYYNNNPLGHIEEWSDGSLTIPVEIDCDGDCYQLEITSQDCLDLMEDGIVMWRMRYTI